MRKSVLSLCLLFFLSSFFSEVVRSECVETEINFDFRNAVPKQEACTTPLPRTVDPVIGGPPISVKFGALVDKDILPSLSKVVTDSYFAAVDELNEVSQRENSNIVFSIEVENTRLNASYAAEKLKYLVNQRGVNVALGPLTSDELVIVGPAGRALGVPVITSTATSIGTGSYSNVFRMVPNDQDHANTLAYMLIQSGFYTTVAVYRSDSFGVPFRDKFQQAYQNLGGNLTLGLPYDPLHIDSTALAKALEEQVKLALTFPRFKQGRIAILLISNDEWQDVVSEFKSPLLLAQFWAGSSGVSRVREPRPSAVNFVRSTGGMVAAGIYIPGSKLKNKILKNLRKRGHNNPDPIAYLAYDSVILAGTTVFLSRSTSHPNYSNSFRAVATYWVGGSGRLKLNSVGDRLYLYFTSEQFNLATGRWETQKVFDPINLAWVDAML